MWLNFSQELPKIRNSSPAWRLYVAHATPMEARYTIRDICEWEKKEKNSFFETEYQTNPWNVDL